MLKAILMCGGKGSRLKMNVEKPMLRVCGKRLIEYTLDALWVCDEVFAVSTKRNKETNKFLKEEGINLIIAPGRGYIHDFMYAVKILRISEPFLLVSSDLIFFEDVLSDVLSKYYECCKKAITCVYEDGSYAGINVVDGYFTIFFDFGQSECKYKVSRSSVVNVNTIKDLKFAESILCP